MTWLCVQPGLISLGRRACVPLFGLDSGFDSMLAALQGTMVRRAGVRAGRWVRHAPGAVEVDVATTKPKAERDAAWSVATASVHRPRLAIETALPV